MQSCCVCAGDLGPALDLESSVARLPDSRKIRRCLGCGLGAVVPQPTEAELLRYYAEEFEDSYVSRGLDFVGGRESLPSHLGSRIVEIERKVGKGRILEIGAGTGAFLNSCKVRGWEVHGTELGVDNVEYAREHFGLTLQRGDILKLGLPAESFDVVHLNHVLEHLTQPPTYLQEIRRVLRRNGLLVLEVPNEFRDLAFKLRGILGVSRVYKVPTPHLFFFTPVSIGVALEKAGFELLELKTPRRFGPDEGLHRRLAKVLLIPLETVVKRGPVIEVWAQSR